MKYNKAKNYGHEKNNFGHRKPQASHHTTYVWLIKIFFVMHFWQVELMKSRHLQAMWFVLLIKHQKAVCGVLSSKQMLQVAQTHHTDLQYCLVQIYLRHIEWSLLQAFQVL